MRTLEISNTSCPIQCKYCPQNKLDNAYPALSLPYFTVNTLRVCLCTVPLDVRIDFSGFADPMYTPQPNFIEMLKMVCDDCRPTIVFTTAYFGSLDDIKMMCELHVKHSDTFKSIVIHLIDNTDVEINDEYNAKLKYLSKPFDKIAFVGKSPIHPDIIPIAYEELELHSRAGNVAAVCLPPYDTINEDVDCINNDYYDHNVVLPNGDVVLCCMDYSLQHKLGNLITGEYKDLKRQPHYDLCRSCMSRKHMIRRD